MKKPLWTLVYEDQHIIAVNKVSGISVGGERWEPGAERLDRLIEQTPPGRGRLWTVHRIDKETSGLVVFALNTETHKALCAAFESRGVEKTYTAIIRGRPSWPGGKAACDLPLVPNGNKKHMTIIDKYRGKPSHTEFALKLSAGNYSIVEARPAMGRTHQIRVHLASMGHPVVCDSLYGKGRGVNLSEFKRGWRGNALEERPLLARLGLHAHRLVLPPLSDSTSIGREIPLSLEAPFPRDMAALIKQMEKCSKVSAEGD